MPESEEIIMYGHRFIYGSNILSKDAFLRKVPGFIERKQRITFEAGVFSADTISRSFNNICQTARNLSGSVDRPDEATIDLFTHAWTIVDHLYALSQIFKPIPQSPPSKLEQFVSAVEPARLLRNKMDHLSANLGNLSAKELKWPLFGIISYFVPTQFRPQDGTVVEGRSTTITAGLIEGDFLSKIQIPKEGLLSKEIDMIEISAFGIELNMEIALRTLRDFLQDLDQEVKSQCLAWAEKRAPEKDISVDEFMKPLKGDLMIHFELKFEADSLEI